MDVRYTLRNSYLQVWCLWEMFELQQTPQQDGECEDVTVCMNAIDEVMLFIRRFDAVYGSTDSRLYIDVFIV